MSVCKIRRPSAFTTSSFEPSTPLDSGLSLPRSLLNLLLHPKENTKADNNINVFRGRAVGRVCGGTMMGLGGSPVKKSACYGNQQHHTSSKYNQRSTSNKRYMTATITVIIHVLSDNDGTG